MRSFSARLVLAVVLVAPAGAQEYVTVVDDSRFESTVKTPAQRIVTLSPHTTELVFAAGAGEQVVGVSEFSDYPPAARDLPTIANGSGIDFEAVVALQPDLVVAWLSGNGMPGINRLRELGLTVIATEPAKIEDIGRWLRLLGDVTGNPVEAEEAARQFDADMAAIQTRYASARQIDLMVEIGQDPLMTLSGAHIVSRLIEICGARHLFEGLLPIAPIVDIEAVYQADPELILQFNPEESEPACSVDAFWAQHDIVTAVRENRVCRIPSAWLSRHTTRLANGATELCLMVDDVRGGESTFQSQEESTHRNGDDRPLISAGEAGG